MDASVRQNVHQWDAQPLPILHFYPTTPDPSVRQHTYSHAGTR